MMAAPYPWKNLMRFAVLAAAACVLLAACGGSDDDESREVPYIRPGGQWWFYDQKQDYVIRDWEEWSALWMAYAVLRNRPAWEAPPVPQVDFSQHMVLGLTRGSAPNLCSWLAIRRVIEHADALEVQYMNPTPDPNSICPQAMAQLTDFVVVVRSDKSVRFTQVDP